MWNPFKKNNVVAPFPEVRRATKRVSVQLQFIAIMEDMIDKLNVETLPMPKHQTLPVPEEVQALMDAGFINHRKVQAFKKQQEILNNEYDVKHKAYSTQSNERIALKSALKLLLKARRVYGPDTLLIPLEQFMQICKKHNLVWGTFDQYTGDIPVKKLQEITRLQSLSHIHEHQGERPHPAIVLRQQDAGIHPQLLRGELHHRGRRRQQDHLRLQRWRRGGELVHQQIDHLRQPAAHRTAL